MTKLTRSFMTVDDVLERLEKFVALYDTHYQAADVLGVDNTTLSRIRSRKRVPTKGVCAVLGVRAETVFFTVRKSK